ncbi:hypothetical protein ARC20_10000 [Stenotrophomonas panacihumi]|uniref:DUF2306 domain-containing protein n=1 Tax=Stenotrophomonas panacihumi TaxID=676599 RepID=A0A0R0AGI6_9GAMM|nr:DUF2306 domain-containing protein [Stenotrophomonas panacihumi]KRG43369.1 hypothetical protein ARC20_10000 [Stenotrophomonas panacihumi]PTN55058.1 DUF2306 domain-containing protein [Stenotrophomonas panacihumi]
MDGTVRSPHAPQGRALRRVGWALLWLVVAWFCGEFLLIAYGKYRHLGSEAYALFAERHGWLWTHLAGGAITLLLGPVQFLSPWWRSRPRLHRWIGRTFLIGMLVACTGATGLIATSPAPFGIRLAFASTALAWLTCALLGLRAILRGHVTLHRRAMTCCYLVTLAPVTFRLMIRIPGLMTLAAPPTMIATLLWVSWVLPLVVYLVGRRVVALPALRRTGVLADTRPAA